MSDMVQVHDLGCVGKTGMFAELRFYPDTPVKRLTLYRKVGSERMVIAHFPLSSVVELGEFLVDVAATHGVE
jgi:hypothetical protein